MDAIAFPDLLREFTYNGAPTLEAEESGLRYFINEYWTSDAAVGSAAFYGIYAQENMVAGVAACQTA